jgi:hypothetical protein
MSDLAVKADIEPPSFNVCFVPRAAMPLLTTVIAAMPHERDLTRLAYGKSDVMTR